MFLRSCIFGASHGRRTIPAILARSKSHRCIPSRCVCMWVHLHHHFCSFRSAFTLCILHSIYERPPISCRLIEFLSLRQRRSVNKQVVNKRNSVYNIAYCRRRESHRCVHFRTSVEHFFCLFNGSAILTFVYRCLLIRYHSSIVLIDACAHVQYTHRLHRIFIIRNCILTNISCQWAWISNSFDSESDPELPI